MLQLSPPFKHTSPPISQLTTPPIYKTLLGRLGDIGEIQKEAFIELGKMHSKDFFNGSEQCIYIQNQQQSHEVHKKNTTYRESFVFHYLLLKGCDEYLPSLFKITSSSLTYDTLYMQKLDCDLDEYMRGLDHPIGLQHPWFLQACKIVHLLHQVGIFHADIKPHNFGVIERSLKIFDFGNSTPLLAGEKAQGLRTTITTRAPEMELLEESSLKADVYSLGCVLFQMITNEQYLFPHISKGIYPLDKTKWCYVTALYKRSQKFPVSLLNQSSKYLRSSYTEQKLIKCIKKTLPCFSNIETTQVCLQRAFKSSNTPENVANAYTHLLENMLKIQPEDRYSMDEVLKDPFWKFRESHIQKAQKPPRLKKQKVA